MRRALVLAVLLLSCRKTETPAPRPQPPVERPSILLVTLDTTRADAIGPATPAFNALAARGRTFDFAYATVPQTLPSHASMMTGLYPGGHGVRENARFLDARQPVVAEKLKAAGYRTAAFVSAFAVAKRFGLGRGFDVYDDDFGEDRAERTAKETTDLALAYLSRPSAQPLFLWVHYYDPHYPYAPPEPFLSRFRGEPYLGEVAFMDEQMGRLIAAFKGAIIVVADHGEGLGEHGEQQHGNLLYQTTMRVPMAMVGSGVAPGRTDTPVSIRRIYHTILDWAGIDAALSLRGEHREDVVAGEAMKPFLSYGWQPQVMAVEGMRKAILAGRIEAYDLASDPRETRNLAAQADLSRAVRTALREYPIPSPGQAEPPPDLDEEARRKLASLGYVSSTVRPVVREDAPVPAEMTRLFPLLDQASGLFVAERYAEAIRLFEQIAVADPYNLDAALRLAAAHSALGNDEHALEAFRKAEAIAPGSLDVRTYLALHRAKSSDWQQAVPQLESIVAEDPTRLPPLEALAALRERQGRLADAVAVRQRIYSLREPTAPELLRLAEMQMNLGQTAPAIASLERARAFQGDRFASHLELGVLYLAARRLAEARDALDRVPAAHPGYAMALFKRAQVSVLLREPDSAARVTRARQHADDTTRPLIARERLFQ